MTLLKKSLFAIAVAMPVTAQAQEPADFERFLQSPAAAAAIASAVAMVGGCSVPLEFDQTAGDDVTSISMGVHCFGTEDDEASVSINFEDYGNGNIIVRGFDLAG
ncbi:MAG: hypothetical protein AAFP80_14910 [Pseudomonadota bacterium]